MRASQSMRNAEPPAMHAVLSAVAAVYPAETESLRASSVSLLGIRATLQHVVDQNLAFLVRLRIDGLQLAEIALLLGALGVCSAGSSISVKSLQSAMARATCAQTRVPRSERNPTEIITVAAQTPNGCSPMQPTEAHCSPLQQAASRCRGLHPTAVCCSRRRPTAAR